MKYLKNFKERISDIDKSNYYQRVLNSSISDEKPFIDIQRQYSEYIIDKISKDIFKFDVVSSGISTHLSGSFTPHIIGGNEVTHLKIRINLKFPSMKKEEKEISDAIYIFQLPDEYFYVHLLVGNISFKCDQIDGVEELLKDLPFMYYQDRFL